MKRMTYRNLMIIIHRIMAKGYTLAEAEPMARHIFERYEKFPLGMSIEEQEKQIISKAEWERMYR